MSTDDSNPQTHLEFTAITDSGRALDISFPLHPHSGSPEAVASMISALLQTLHDGIALLVEIPGKAVEMADLGHPTETFIESGVAG